MFIQQFDNLQIHSFPSGPYQTNSYLVVNSHLNQAFLLDAPFDIEKSLAPLLQQYSLSLHTVVITHSHWDHIGGLISLKQILPHLAVLIHKDDSFNLKSPGSDMIPSPLAVKGVDPTHELTGDETVQLVGYNWTVLHTPGHSLGSICLYQPDHKILFSGDTLFQGTFGNTSFPYSNHQKMQSSLRKLAELPPETTVFPGHGLPTTIKAESSWIIRKPKG